jgi:hypothetical protein
MLALDLFMCVVIAARHRHELSASLAMSLVLTALGLVMAFRGALRHHENLSLLLCSVDRPDPKSPLVKALRAASHWTHYVLLLMYMVAGALLVAIGDAFHSS